MCQQSGQDGDVVAVWPFSAAACTSVGYIDCENSPGVYTSVCVLLNF